MNSIFKQPRETLFRSSLRAKRSNPFPPSKERMDCFVASLLAMTARHIFAFSRRNPPEFCQQTSRPHIRGRRECRAPGAPAAACARVGVEGTRVSQVTPKHPAFPAQWFTAYFALSPVIGLFCHRRSASHPAKLDASVEASGPHDFAVRFSTVRQRRIRVHRIPPRVRDDREPPLCGTGRLSL
jgi:hypothetical protein